MSKEFMSRDSSSLYRELIPHLLLMSFTMILLAAVWLTAWSMSKVARESSARSASASSMELADTYEAQVVRNLREIDQTLKIVRYAYGREDASAPLVALKANALLPSDLLFQITVADNEGRVVASNRPIVVQSIADQPYFYTHQINDALWVGRSLRQQRAPGHSLQFSRRLNEKDGRFAGAVVISVDPAYFVSGYDAARLGKRGVLGILGSDGFFRIRRSGDIIHTDQMADYAALINKFGEDRSARLLHNSWDNERRYTSVRELFSFPLAVVVGLSAEEQMADVEAKIVGYWWWAAGLSAVLLFITVILARMSAQLANKDKRIRHLAFHDPLTGMPNRQLLLDRLQQHLMLAGRKKVKIGVMFVDLDRFKAVNDSYGHDIGDGLLKELADRLTGTLRHSDTVARIGGDEFVVILTEIQEASTYATIAQKMIDKLTQPALINKHELQVSVSVGISCFPEDGLDAALLIKQADTAMYAAKGAGGGTYRFFQARMTDAAVRHLELEVALRHAVGHGELELFYQPKISFANNQICGVEALVRWNRPGYGLVTPNDFIPMAEETGIIFALGNWVLEAACKQALDWKSRGFADIKIAVNISGKQMHRGDLVERIVELTSRYGISPSRLEVELTESVIMSDPDRVSTTLTKLRELGVTIAIDDFGTGYSSLAYLHRLPVDVIKIDRAFVMKLGDGNADDEIVKVIVALGSALKLIVVAEGVETEAQAVFLKENGSTSAQGYLYSKPRRAREIEDLLPTLQDTAHDGFIDIDIAR